MSYGGGYQGGYATITVESVTLTDSTFHARAAGYGARIANTWVRLAPAPDAPLHYYTRDSLAARSQDSSNSYENVLDIGHSFARSDQTGGAGLDFFPRPLVATQRETDQIRFWDSMNVDVRKPVAGNLEYALRLHRKLEEWDNPGNATHLLRTSDLFYVAEGNYVYWYDTLANTVAEGSHNFSNPIDGLCRLGDDVYALSNNVILKKGSADSAFSSWHTPGGTETVEQIWGVKGRIVAHRTTTTPSNEFVEFSGAGAATVVGSFDEDMVINDVIDGGPAVLVALDTGEINSYTLDSSLQLELISSSVVPIGEQVISMATTAGVLAYITIDPTTVSSNTIARFYTAKVLDSRFNFVIGEMQLIYEWNSPITGPRVQISPLLASRDDFWWAVYEPDVAGSKYVSLFRYDVETRGYNRAHAIGVSSATDPNALIIFEDRFVFLNDDDVWAEAVSTYADVGWLISPFVTFGLNTDINWVATVLDVTNIISGGEQVEILRTSDIDGLLDWQDSTWVSEQTITAPEQAGSEVVMSGVKQKRLSVQLRLYPHSSGTPGIQRFAIRGLPAHRDMIVDLPVNISDMIEVPGRSPRRALRHGDSIHTKLFNMQGAHVELNVIDPPMSLLGIVDEISEPVTYLTSRGSQGRRCIVRFRGKMISATVVTVGSAGMGVGGLGITTMGIGEITEIA